MNDIDTSLDGTSPEDPRARLLDAPMSRYQVVGIAVVAVICGVDGFDILAITFAAPALALQWGLGRGQVGLLLSIGLFTMAAGSVIIAPAADVFGRRALVFVSLILITSGTAWTAVAPGFGHVLWSRALTGLGVGTMMSVINPLAAEYANRRGRYLSLSLLNIGYPAGGLLGGLAAAWLLVQFDWRAIFVFAAALGVVLIGVVWQWLPDPLSFLLVRRKPDSLARVNAYLARCGIEPVPALPPPMQVAGKAPLYRLFSADMRGRTAMVTCVYVLYEVTLYYVFSWVPSLVAGMGFSAAQGTLVSAMVNLGGIAGGLCVGVAATRFGLKPTARVAVILGAIMTASFGMAAARMNVLLFMSITTGFFLLGGVIAILSAIWITFPAQVRASGTGLSMGIGRIGAGIAPAVAGWLFSIDFAPATVSVLMALPAVAAGAVLWRLPLPSSTNRRAPLSTLVS